MIQTPHSPDNSIYHEIYPGLSDSEKELRICYRSRLPRNIQANRNLLMPSQTGRVQLPTVQPNRRELVLPIKGVAAFHA